jgi:DNA-binding MarR family transcriptional regulator
MKINVQNNSVNYLLIQVCKAWRNKANEMLAKYSVHAGQDVLLSYLGKEDGQTVSSLVDNVCIQHATMIRMLDRMEATGLVNKIKDNNDMRVSRIFLTDKGKEAVKNVRSVWKAMEQNTSSAISEKDQITLRRILQDVLKNMQ